MADRTPYDPSTFCWVELATHDAPAAERFYCALFGWVAHHARSGERGPTTTFVLAGRRVAALRELVDEDEPHWAGFVCVDSADDCAREAERAGGTVVRAPHDVGDAGRTAVLADPSGARFHVCQPREHRGAAVVNEPGAFCWNELATHDTAACRAFYVALFGWTPITTQHEQTEYTTFMRGDAPLSGMLSTTAESHERPAEPARWMTYFAVADCNEASARAVELGGGLLVPPTDIPPVGRFAVVRDPQGAVFSIVELLD